MCHFSMEFGESMDNVNNENTRMLLCVSCLDLSGNCVRKQNKLDVPVVFASQAYIPELFPDIFKETEGQLTSTRPAISLPIT